MEKSEVNQSSPMVVFECRGCEFVDFEPRVRPICPWACPRSSLPLQGSWRCQGVESGTVFEDFEFEDGRWDDYDEKV